MGKTMVTLTGTPVAPGLAVGPLARLAATAQVARPCGSPAEARDAFAAAIGAAQEELAVLLARTGNADEVGIVAFHIALLEDQKLTNPAHAAIYAGNAAD